jgi:anaerobic ribonucleoside-triphosphate reductase activating protein
MLQVAQIVPCTEAEGPGRRFALWFQGCPLRCPGCCNPEMLSFSGGQAMGVTDVIKQIETVLAQTSVEGITLLGGEPLAHAGGAAALAKAAQKRGLSVMVFTGYTLAEAVACTEPAVRELLDYTDLLVDGPYLREQPEPRRRWIGSANQCVHFLTNRYRPDDPCWQRPNTLEIRLHRGEVTINGFPAAGAMERWKRGR